MWFVFAILTLLKLNANAEECAECEHVSIYSSVKCGSKNAKNVEVELLENSDTLHVLAKNKTNERGFFKIEGSSRGDFNFEPVLKIRYSCEKPKNRIGQTIIFDIRREFITKRGEQKKTFSLNRSGIDLERYFYDEIRPIGG